MTNPRRHPDDPALPPQSRGDVAIVVPAAGAGVRLGFALPKALYPLAGVPLVAHAVRRLLDAPSVGYLVVVAPSGHEAAIHAALASLSTEDTSRWGVVTGGSQRQESVARGLAALPSYFDIVLVHDAARALTPVSLVEDVAAAVRGGQDAVVPVLPVVDTVIQVDPGGGLRRTLDRDALRAVQTPQGFRRPVLAAAHAAAADASSTDDAGLVARLGLPVHTVAGSEQAMKITTARDAALAEFLLSR